MTSAVPPSVFLPFLFRHVAAVLFPFFLSFSFFSFPLSFLVLPASISSISSSLKSHIDHPYN
ncbi:hypothetical protein RchiOBHm_Chr2g0154261 [Rosa chinensis]|uniref:Uncharacterized protein n=1 Tax=Rosa chinensis TaxID=74649 RepID=A0A2P6S0X2_ROSCH|nr:hypothetical protein RchiOBHm_Chr2g0154261 [Rosa chinensis]